MDWLEGFLDRGKSSLFSGCVIIKIVLFLAYVTFRRKSLCLLMLRILKAQFGLKIF